MKRQEDLTGRLREYIKILEGEVRDFHKAIENKIKRYQESPTESSREILRRGEEIRMSGSQYASFAYALDKFYGVFPELKPKKEKIE